MRWRPPAGRFGAEERGNIAVMFALLLPALALMVAGAVDLAHVTSSRARLQDVADAAALAAAQELGLAIDDAAAEARANAFVQSHLANWPQAPSVTPAIKVLEVDGRRVVEVHLDGHRPSFFMSLLPPGGWNFAATARATAVGMTPLCVLTIADTKDKVLNVKDQSRLRAPACLVHSNRDILVEGGRIEAALVQAVTSARGTILPGAGTGAALIEDPFAGLALESSRPCSDGNGRQMNIDSGTTRLAAGVHCGGYTVAGSGRLILEPGDHWFQGGHLEIKEDAVLEGEDVVLFFDRQSKFEFKDRSLVNLDGRESGPYAGMVMMASRDNTQDFIIFSDNVERLHGVIYVPNATMIVDGKAEVARDSAWTVIVARQLQLKGSPSLIINASYASSDVPVPSGVGPTSGGTVLLN